MTPSHDLFELLKSMNQNEKGYVKKQLSAFKMNSQNKLLLEAISKQSVYDEAQLLKKFKSLQGNRFAVAKNYLYEFVLDVLNTYRRNEPKRKLRGLMCSIETLYEKGLETQTAKAIEKAKKLARHYELNLCLLEIADWELRFLMNKPQSKAIYADIEKHSEAQDGYLKHLDTIAASKKTYNLIRNSHLTIGMARGGNTTEELEMLLKRMTQHDTSDHHFLSRYYYHFASAINDFTNNRFKKAYDHALFVENLWEDRPHMKTLYPDLYIFFLTRKMLFEERLHLFGKVFKTIETGNEFIRSGAILDSTQKSTFYVFTLGMCNQSVQYDKALKTIERIMQFRKTLSGKRFDDVNEQLLVVTMVDTYFEKGDFKNANKWVNRIFNEQLNYRDDVYCFAFVTSIMIHFELNHTDLLGYKVKAAKALLKKRKRLHRTEALVLDFINYHADQTGPQSIPKEAYRKLKAEILELIKDPFESNVLNYFDFLVWIDSKLEGRSYESVKKQKLRISRGHGI